MKENKPQTPDTIEVVFEEYMRLKDIETRFAVLKEQAAHDKYVPAHIQIILGIENVKKELDLSFAMQASHKE